MHISRIAELRKSAARRFWGVTVLLFLSFLLVIAARYAQGRIAANYGRATLARESAALTREYLRYEADRGENLAALPPPADLARLDIWARRVQDQLDQGAAVFVIDRPALMWIRRPARFEHTADSVSALIMNPESMSGPAEIKRYGDTQVLRTSFDVGGDLHTLFLFTRGRDSLAWGALASSNATWISFFRVLTASAAETPQVGDPAWALEDIFALPRSPTQRWNIGLRAFLGDSLIYESPGLDTTRPAITYDFNGRRAQCYLSRWQETSTHWQFLRIAIWPMLLFPIVLIVLFRRDYKTILELTEPEGTNPPE